uniref:Ig-like domain-containing protein n=1 Tax=Cyprinodon variegatus TaxID=28743 RepID=A0A3Q2EDT3_CYPVA
IITSFQHALRAKIWIYSTGPALWNRLVGVKHRKKGSSVTLSCTYNKGSTNDLFWYRQYPGKPPEFLKSHSPFGEAEKLGRLKFEAKEDKMNMTISSAVMTDSAVYYCALQPTVTGNTITLTLYKNLKYLTKSTRGHKTSQMNILIKTTIDKIKS